MTLAHRLSILKYWQLLECFAWQAAPKLDRDAHVRSLEDGFPWPEQSDPTCCALVRKKAEELGRRIDSVTWQHSVFLGIASERGIVEELFRHAPTELELLPKDFRGDVPMLVVNAGTDGKVGQESDDGVALPAFDPENLEVARWPWALAQWIRSGGKPQAWTDDFEEFRGQIIELCREAVLRTEPDGEGFFRLTGAALGAIESGLLGVLRTRCATPDDQPLASVFTDLRAPRVDSRFRVDPNAPFDPPLLNSFFVDDLSKAVADAGKSTLGGVLDRYVAMTTGEEKVELDLSKSVDSAKRTRRWNEIYASFNSSSLPRGTWPKPFGRQLYFAQQLACNRILMGRAGEEIVGVNGPPGTGKTTLLRDVVAEILVRRAEKLANLVTASDGFSKRQEGNSPRTLYRVSPDLRGFEIIVASQNNAAVENITRELPNIDDFCLDPAESDRGKKSAEEKAAIEGRIISGIDHFAEVSDAILKESVSAADADGEQSDRELSPSWGLISAPLGNKERRKIVANAIFPYLNSDTASPFLRAIINRACAALGPELETVAPEFVRRAAGGKFRKQEVDDVVKAAQPRFEAEFETAKQRFKNALNDFEAVLAELRLLEKDENDRTFSRNRVIELKTALSGLADTVASKNSEVVLQKSVVREAEEKQAKTERDYQNAGAVAAWRRTVAEFGNVSREHRGAEAKLSQLRDQLISFALHAEEIAAEVTQAQSEAAQAAGARPRGIIRMLKGLVARIGEAETRYHVTQARHHTVRGRLDTHQAAVAAIRTQIDSLTVTVRRHAGLLVALEMEQMKLQGGAERAARESPELNNSRDLEGLLAQMKTAADECRESVTTKQRHLTALKQSAATAEASRAECEREIARSSARAAELDNVCHSREQALGIAGTIRRAYALSNSERQKAKPLMGDRIHRARMAVFLEALRLHRAFVLAAIPQMRRNLSFACDVLSGKIGPEDSSLVGDAWASLSLLIPVVSTTFASASRLFARVTPGSLGWAMIDEAGQAPPQYAVGLARLVRRCVVVGDPLQLPPVVPMPAALTEHLRSRCGVSDPSLHAHDCSVQMIADRLTTMGSEVSCPSKTDADRKLWVGCPLYVHNRCANPIFKISNELSYGGRMVLGRSGDPKRPEPPVVRPLGSFWLDVGRPQKTEMHATGDDLAAVAWILKSMRWQKPSHVYVISPFREVRDRVRERVSQGSKIWRERSIGTVHTFQGKQADCVVLVLGGRSEGARNWAGHPANLLNVAASRAKESLIVVGSFERWRDYVKPFSTMNRVAWRHELQTLSLHAAGIPVGGDEPRSSMG